MDIRSMPLLLALEQHASRNNIPFHMPGHKENERNFEELELIRHNLYRYDKTEVSELDNLHHATGVILEAQKLAANAFGAGRSWFLVNGSTSGIYSMITGVTKPKDKIIVQRNCHRSIHMAAFIGELEVRYVLPELARDFGVPAGLSVQAAVDIMDQNPDAKAIVLVHPSYYGICSDLEAIAIEAHKRSMLVLVDEAHGAHFPFHDALPRTALACGADITVTSIHKSLPALTQASLLSINKDFKHQQLVERIEFMLRLYQSSSPSYVLMASIDAARSIMQRRGRKMLSELLECVESLKVKIDRLTQFKVLDKKKNGTYGIAEHDWTKLVIGYTGGGVLLATILEQEYNIIVEMADLHNVVLITTVGDPKESFDRLFQALKEIDQREVQLVDATCLMTPPEFQYRCDMRTAFYSENEVIYLEKAVGRTSTEMVVPYPPGIPVLLPGEFVTQELVDYIRRLKTAGIQISGMEDCTAEQIRVMV